MARSRKHVEELLKLPREERSEIAEALLESLEDDNRDADSVEDWAAEIMERIERNEPGVAAETVFADGRDRLGLER
jgi:hypothetical protein